MLTRRNKAEPVVRRGFASASFSPLRSLLPTTNRINRITIFVNYLFQNPRYSRRSVAGVTKKVCARVPFESRNCETGTGIGRTRHVTRVAHVARR